MKQYVGLLRRSFFDFRAFLLVDWVVKFEVQFIVYLVHMTQQQIGRFENRKNTCVKSRFICTRENFDSAPVLFVILVPINDTVSRLTLETHNETDHVVESIFRCHEKVSDDYRFAHPNYDPVWTGAVAVLLIFFILVILGTIAEIVLDFLEKKRESSEKPEITISELPVKDEKLHGVVNEAYAPSPVYDEVADFS